MSGRKFEASQDMRRRARARRRPVVVLNASINLRAGRAILLALVTIALCADTGTANVGVDLPGLAEEPAGESHEEVAKPGGKKKSDHHGPDLPTEPIPLLLDDDLPKRTPPMFEFGAPLLGPGKLKRGIELPTGAVWTPALWVFGTYRTGVSYIDPGSNAEELVEMPHRFDLLLNLQLAGTERLVAGFQPLHRDGRFTTYTFSPDEISGGTSEANFDLATLFFEGDFNELFPKIDPMDRRGLDIGFAVGRQQIEFQDGIMFNDRIDSLGVVRNGLSMAGIPKIRTTFLFGWNDIHRGDNRDDGSARLYAILTEADTVHSTVELDVAYIDSDQYPNTGGDGLYIGVGATQRIGLVNTTLRVNSSHALDDASPAVDDGILIVAQISKSPRASHNVIYANAYWGIDRYTSASRDPTAGGPLGSIGLLFGAVGLGRYTPALGSRVDESWGLAAGYQWFWDGDRTQLVIEAGGREGTSGSELDAVALGGRLQRKLGRRFLLQFDGYVTEPSEGDTRFGLRSEILIRF